MYECAYQILGPLVNSIVIGAIFGIIFFAHANVKWCGHIAQIFGGKKLSLDGVECV